jgi:hypothetical protein
MLNREGVGLVCFLVLSVIANIALHWSVICREVYRRGGQFPTGLLFWRVFNELRIYRNIRLARGQSLNMYYAAFILSWFNLLLALGVALRLLYLHTQGGLPDNY